jgi:hypothetical protein
MSGRTIRILAVAVVVLFAAVWLVSRKPDSGPAEDALLFPGLEARLDEITAVTVTGSEGEVRIQREGDRWIVPAKDGYRADMAKLRGLLLALAEARKVEQKTANPELYERIGVQDPKEEDADGVLVGSEGLGDADFAVILGNSAQRDYRYVRIADEATSWLIDRNPEVPDDATGWLVSDLTDVPASRVQSVEIRHEDGETIRIRKESEDDTNFTVDDIPEGRELSYASVANSIAAALDNLSLDDVRKAGSGTDGAATAASAGDGTADDEDDAPGGASAAPTKATTVFRTFDGLEITVDSTGTEDETWIQLRAAALPPAEDAAADAAAPAGDASGSGDEAAGDTTPDDGANGGDAALSSGGESVADAEDGDSADAAQDDVSADAAEAGAEADAAEEDAPDPQAEAGEINARVAGWEYRIPQYKASQLRRRWEDLLRAPETEDEGE